MKHRILVLILTLTTLGLAACGLETKPGDPNMLLPNSERPPAGPGLFTGEDGAFIIKID